MSEKNTWRVIYGGGLIVLVLLIYMMVLVKQDYDYNKSGEVREAAMKQETIEKIDRIMHAHRN